MRRRRDGTRTLPTILAAVLCLSSAAAADDPAPTPLRYRRVLVPRDALAELTRGYLPMKREEFAARMADLVAATRAADRRVAWVASGEYTARFDAGQLVAGVARLHIVHTAAEPTCVSFAPAALAMGPATWQGTSSPRAAVTGTDPSGTSVVQVTESGVLEYPWTLRGEPGERGAYRFLFALTAAPRSRLEIDLPATYELLPDQGLIADVEDVPPQAAAGATPGALRRWTVELGGISALELTVAPRAARSRRSPLVRAAQSLRYRLETDSVQVDCDLDLDMHQQPLGELQLETDDALLITSVRLGRLDLHWQSLPGEEAAGRIIRIPLPERITGTPARLEVSAVAALQTQTTWRLPTLRPRHVLWRQGTMSLEVPAALELRHLRLQQAQQSGVSVHGGESPHTTLQFELFGPESALEVVLAPRTAEVVAEVGTTIDLNSGAVTGTVVTDLRCLNGERFDLQALVPNAWAVDGVESEPGVAVQDYQFVAYEAQFKRLQIRLAQPLQAGQSVRLTIRAHRSPSASLGSDDLRPVRWVAVTPATQQIALVPDTNFRLDLRGDASLERRDPAGLSPADARRLRPRTGCIVFDDNGRASQVAVTMVREEPAFAANVAVDVEVAPGALTESYRVTCTPDAAPLERIQVHFSEPRPAELAWRWVGDEPGILSARRLQESAEEGVATPRGDEVWEIVLRAPQRAPFELRCQRTTPVAPPCAVALATLPQAASHAGQLTLRAKDGRRLAVQVQGATAIPGDPTPPNTATTALACYRYDASKTARVTLQPPADGDRPAACWAWRCRVRARREPEGPTHHAATLFLENTGVTDLRVALPADSVYQGLDINGEPAPQARRADPDGSFLLALPAGQRFLRVEMRYLCPGRPLGVWSDVSVALPHLDIPVLDRRVHLWIPPGYRPVPSSTSTLDEPLPTWFQRLLGPVAARTGSDGALATVATLWAWLRGAPATAPDVAAQGEMFLEHFGSVVRAAPTESAREPRTWRMAFGQYLVTGAQPGPTPTIRVDAEQLTQAEFSLEAPLPPAYGETPAAAAESVLRQGDLLLVAHRGQLCLTSRRLATRYPSPGKWRAGGVLFLPDRSSPVAREMDAIEVQDGPAPLPLPTWVAVPTLADPPWQSLGGDAPSRDLGGGRWLDVSPGAATGRCTLRVERPGVLWAVGWCGLVGMAALVVLLGRRGRAVCLGMVLVAAAAVAAPPSLVPLTSGLFPGMLAGLLLNAVRGRWVPTTSAAGEPAAGPGLSVVAVFLVAVGLSLVTTRPAPAASPPEPPPADADRPVYALVVPVDASLTPTGQYDYLPVDFYDALHRLSVADAHLSGGWLAMQADYRLAFHTRPQRATMEVTTFSATYRLLVLAAHERLWFPWEGPSPSDAVLEARWNSRPLELEWNAARTALALPASPPGPGVLELTLRAEVRETPGMRQFGCAIPRIARSRLELDLPAGAPQLQVTSALGATQVDGVTGIRHVDLGPASSLDLQWSSGGAEEASVRPVPLAELLWLRVCPPDHPESVRLAARLQLQPAGQRITELTLRVDPQLRWLAPADPSPFEVTTAPADQADTVLMTLRWRAPVEDEVTVPLEFELLNASGLGNIPLPRLETVGTRTSRRWLAISVAPHLEVQTVSSDLDEPCDLLDSAEFLAAWGGGESAPQLCCRLAAEGPGCSLATRPRQPLTSSRERVDVSVGPDRLDLVLEAKLETTNGEVFQHRLSVPHDLQVTSAVVLSGQADVALPVEYDGSGFISVFLRGGVTGAHDLLLRGHVPRAADTNIQPLPRLTLADATVRSQAAYVYRKPEVLLEVRAPKAMARVSAAAEGAYREPFGRLAGAFAAFDGPLAGWAETTLRIEANHPRLDARLVVVLQHDADQWRAIADVDARLVGEAPGVVDLVRFELPPEWIGPLTLEPAAPFEIRALPGQRRQLLIRPLEPVSDRLKLRIRGSVSLGPAEHGRTPDILPLDVANAARFFVLPTRWDQQRIEWASPGLVEVPLVDVVPPDLADAGGQIAFRAWGRPRAVIMQIEHEAGERQVALADIQVRCTAEGGWYGVASFAIQPAGADNCTLEVPRDVELVHLEIDGVPAMVIPQQARLWHVRLVSEQLPQQLTIVFRATGPDRTAPPPEPVAVPWPTDVPVRQTLWTVYRATGGPWEEAGGQQRAQVSPAHQESLRLAALADLVAASADAALSSSPRDVQVWYTPWAERIASAAAGLAHAQAGPGSPVGPARAEAPDAVLQQQELVAQRLKVAPTVMDFVRQANRQPQPRDLWAFAAGGRIAARHYAFAGSAPTLPLRATSETNAGWGTTLLAAASILAAAAGLGLLTRWGVVAHAWRRWPQAVGVLVGVTWWLVAAPSVLGWLIVGASVWNAIRLPWATGRAAADGAERGEPAFIDAAPTDPDPPARSG